LAGFCRSSGKLYAQVMMTYKVKTPAVFRRPVDEEGSDED
jgi:hypothetical protein